MRKKIFISVLMAWQTTYASAGWTSGGGKLIKFANNPWFLENTNTVTYCIDMDEDNFGIRPFYVKRDIERAILTWKTTFADLDASYYQGNLVPFGEVRVATQEFIDQPCSADTDIRFQIGQLTDSQLAYFDDPKEHVGAAIRTDYNLETLRSKGFVYIAPSQGVLRPNLPQMHPNPWNGTGARIPFFYVLLHELGHVFGLSHSVPFALMDESLPETAISNEFIEAIANERTEEIRQRQRTYEPGALVGFLNRLPDISWGGCITQDQWPFHLEALEIPTSDTCYGLLYEYAAATKTLTFDVKSGHWPPSLIGAATLREMERKSKPFVRVYLPDEQTVFSGVPDNKRNIFGEVVDFEIMLEGQYLSTDGQNEIPLRMKMGAGHRGNMFGVKNGSFYDKIINTLIF